jgi:RNA polymerase sigma factor (sigma-70 family)
MNSVLQHVRSAALRLDGGGMTDGQLLERFLACREEAAFEALVRRHGPMVLGVCRRVLNNLHDAEDAFQATFLVLVRKAASLLPRRAVGNWLYGVAYHTALKARAAIVKRRTREAQVRDMPRREVLTDDAGLDWQPLLDQELSRLPDKFREPVVLCDLEGKTRKEAAGQLGIPEGTLSGRLTTARRRLAKRLARQGVTLSAGSLAAVLLPNTASAGVPAPLVVSTVKAAALLVAGEPAAGVISAQVAVLTEGVLKAMLMTKLKMTAAVLLMVGGVVMGGGALVERSLADTRADRPAVAKEQPRPRQAEGRQEMADDEVQPPREQAKGEATFPGALQSVDAAKNTITVKGGTNIRQTGPMEKTFELAKDLVILRDGKPAKLSDLKQGGRVTVKLAEDGKTAVSISETGKTMMALWKSADPANNTITVTVTTGGRGGVEKKDVTHELAKDGKVMLEGKEVKLADLKDVKLGSTLQLTFSVDDEKKLVRIQYSTRNR